MNNRKGKNVWNALAIMLVFIMLFSMTAPASYADEIVSSEIKEQEQIEHINTSTDDNKLTTASAIETDIVENEDKEQIDPSNTKAEDKKVTTKAAIEKDISETNNEEQSSSSDKITNDNSMLSEQSAENDEVKSTKDDKTLPKDDSNTSTSSAVETAKTEEQTNLLKTTAEEVETPAKESTYWTDNLTETPDGFTIDESDPNNITISSAEGLAWLAVLTQGLNGQEIDAFEGKTITLTEDIDLSGKLWTPIGRYERKLDFSKGRPSVIEISLPFKGIFDGSDHIISDLKLTTLSENSSSKYQGLFGVVKEGTIKNIHLRDVYIDTVVPSAGSLVGRMADSFVENCTVTGILKSKNGISGVVESAENSNFSKCAFSGKITGKFVSGIVGNNNHGVVDQCFVDADFLGQDKENCGSSSSVEPIASALNGISISNCYTIGKVESEEAFGRKGKNIGGISDLAENEATIENCYSAMSITGGNDIAGIVGSIRTNEGSDDAAPIIRGCIALNNTLIADGHSGDAKKEVGRIVGEVSTGTNSDGKPVHPRMTSNYAYKGTKVYRKDDGNGDTRRLIGLPLDSCKNNAKNGENISCTDISDGNWTVEWDSEIWEFAAGKLPILKNISPKMPQPGEMPSHISADSEKDWNITAFDINGANPEVTLGSTEDDAIALLPDVLFCTKDDTIAASIPNVTWSCSNFDGNTVGEYDFTADFPEEGYTINTPPVAKVNVVLKYKVSFITYGAGELDTLEICDGATIEKPEDPKRKGFVFEGWYKDEARTELWDFDTDIVTSPTTLYAKWSIDGEPDYTATESGVQPTLDVSGKGFMDTFIVSISDVDGFTTAAVVANQKIIFSVPAGEYVIEWTGRDVGMKTTEHFDQNAGVTPAELCYKGIGTVNDPYTLLSTFFIKDGSSATTLNKTGATFRVWNLIAGYETEGVTYKNTPFVVKVEDRDYMRGGNGRLNASFIIDGNRMGASNWNGWYRSPGSYGIALNPSEDLIKDTFDPNDSNSSLWHALYNPETYKERYDTAVETLEGIKADENKVLMFNTQTRDFTGPITYKIDISGYFENGDAVNINYLLGAANKHLYHGLTLDENYMLALEPTYIKNNTSAVVEDGYITFDLYNGGYFELVKQENDTPRTKYVVEFVANKNTNGELYPSTIYPQILDAESGYKVTKPEAPKEKGYTFGGWYTDKKLTKQFDFNTTISDDIMLYAKWNSNSGTGGTGGESGGEIVGKTYKVEFVTGKTATGEKTATLPLQKVEEGKKATDPGKDKRSCPFGFYDRGDGYLVLDWYTDLNLKNKFRFSNSITKDTKLYPKYQRYILKDDGRVDSGKGTKSNPYKVKLGDTKQSKIAWKFFNKLASGKLSGYYKVYAEKKNKGDELFSWTFNGSDFKKCDTAQPYYVYVDTNKVGNTLELKMANRTAIEGKVTISVDVSKYIKKDCEVDVEYKDDSCDGMVAHSNFKSDNWVQTHHKPKACFTNAKADVEDGYVTFDIHHGGTYIIKSDQIKADDKSPTGTTAGTGKVIEKEKVKAGEKINTTKMNQIVKDKKLLLVESKEGNILFDLKAVQTLKKEIMGTLKVDIDLIKNVKLTEKQKEKAAKKIENRPVYELEVKTGNKSISTFGGGKVTVTLPYTLKATEKSSGLVMWHLKDDGELVDIPCTYDAKKKEVTFKTTHFSYYVVGYDKNLEWDSPFSDVKESDWFYRAIAYVNKNNLMSGISKDKFMPNGKTTRAMLVTVLYRNEGSPKVENKVAFKDVKESKWYTDAVCWAVKNDIITGYNELTFGTNDPITREQLVSILYRYGKMKKMDMKKKGQIDDFKDSNLVSSWASDGIKWAVGAEVLKGKGNNTLDPKGKATRAEVATVIQKVLKIEGNQ